VLPFGTDTLKRISLFNFSLHNVESQFFIWPSFKYFMVALSNGRKSSFFERLSFLISLALQKKKSRLSDSTRRPTADTRSGLASRRYRA
jgi:hypothetical protein